jgi:hypothetical protein
VPQSRGCVHRLPVKELKVRRLGSSEVHVPLFCFEINELIMRLLVNRCTCRCGLVISGNETLVAVAFSISHTKCQKRGLFQGFWGPFGFFRMECMEFDFFQVFFWEKLDT